MIKSLTILIAALTAGFLATSEASAGLSFNGRKLNGISENGRNLQGRNLNGRNLNGAARDGAVTDQGVHATTVILKDGARVTLK